MTRVWVRAWELECCGPVPAVGDVVSWPLVARPSAVADAVACRHGDLGPARGVRGTVTAVGPLQTIAGEPGVVVELAEVSPTASAVIAEAVLGEPPERDRLLVAIDGPPESGQLAMAFEVAAALGLPHAVVDLGHWRREPPAATAAGWLEGAYDIDALLARVLRPFLAGEPRVWLHPDEEPAELPSGAVLVVAGAYLMRSELRSLWHYSAYLELGDAACLERLLARDPGAAEHYEEVLAPAQAIYVDRAQPQVSVNALVDVADVDHPVVRHC